MFNGIRSWSKDSYTWYFGVVRCSDAASPPFHLYSLSCWSTKEWSYPQLVRLLSHNILILTDSFVITHHAGGTWGPHRFTLWNQMILNTIRFKIDIFTDSLASHDPVSKYWDCTVQITQWLHFCPSQWAYMLYSDSQRMYKLRSYCCQ